MVTYCVVMECAEHAVKLQPTNQPLRQCDSCSIVTYLQLMTVTYCIKKTISAFI